MHLRYLNEDDLDLLLQAEEEDMEPRHDGPQLLLPPPCAAVDAAALWHWPIEREGSASCSMEQQCGAAEDVGTQADGPARVQQHVGIFEEARDRSEERMHVLRWLKQQRSAVFEVEETDKKTLWKRKQGAAGGAAAEPSCVDGCAGESSKVNPAATTSISNTQQNGSQACRVRAVGLFKYDLRDEHSNNYIGASRLASHGSRCAALEAEPSASRAGADASKRNKDKGRSEGGEVTSPGESYTNITAANGGGHTTTDGAKCDRDEAGDCSKKGNAPERTEKSRNAQRRERLIGYVWAEEDAAEEDQGKPPQEIESREGCRAAGNVCSRLIVRRVFLKRERRRQTLGTHLLQAFLAATYKQLLQEQQPAVCVAPGHQQPQTGATLQAQKQGQQKAISNAGQHTDNMVTGMSPQCGGSHGEMCKIRRTREEQEIHGKATTEATETRKSREAAELKPHNVKEERESKAQGETAVGEEREKSEVEVGIDCKLQLENVPHYLVDVLKEGGFCVEAPAAEEKHAESCNSTYCMHVSLAHWYTAFVLSANV